MPQTRARPALYQYRLEFFKSRGGQRVHEVPLARADFDRAVEAAFIEGLRRGEFSRYAPPFDSARVEPCFEGDGPNAPVKTFRQVIFIHTANGTTPQQTTQGQTTTPSQ